jgi:hypothetical protein
VLIPLPFHTKRLTVLPLTRNEQPAITQVQPMPKPLPPQVAARQNIERLLPPNHQSISAKDYVINGYNPYTKKWLESTGRLSSPMPKAEAIQHALRLSQRYPALHHWLEPYLDRYNPKKP